MKANQIIFSINYDRVLNEVKISITHISQGISEDDAGELKSNFMLMVNNDMLNTCGESQEFFVFLKLRSGRYCIFSLQQIKENADNSTLFSCHALILSEGYFDIYPIQAYDTSVIKPLEKSVEISKDVVNLAPVNYVLINPKISYDRAAEFIKKTKGFGLRHMIDVLISREGSSVELKDTMENTISWIIAIQMAFPLKKAHNINFLIKGWSNGNTKYCICRLTMNENNLFNQDLEDFRSFDFINKKFAKPLVEHRFTRLVDMGYLISKETLDAFHRFLDRFNYDKLDEEIEHCYRLFNLINFGIGKMESRDVKSAVEFALKYSSQSFLEDIFERLDPMMDKIALEIDIENAMLICSMLFRIANKAKKKLFINRSYNFFLNSFDNIVFKNNDFSKEDIFQLYKDIREVNRDRIEEFSSNMMSPVRFKRMRTLLQEGEFPKQAFIYIQVILHELASDNYTWNRAVHIDYFKEFIDISLEMVSGMEDYTLLLGTAAKKPDILVSFTIALYNKVKMSQAIEHLMRSFNEVLGTMEKKDAWEARIMIHELNPESKFLFQEFEVNIKYVENKQEYFWSYFVPEKGEFPEYFRKNFSNILKLYLKNLPEEIIDKECTRLIEYVIDDELFIEGYTITFIIKSFENQLPMEMPEEKNEKLIKDIHEYKSDRGIRTNPDITGLVTYGINLCNETGSERMGMKEILDNLPPIEALEKDKYISYIKWVLPELMKFADLPEDYAVIMDALCPPGVEEEFLNLYSMHLANTSQNYSTAYGFLNCYLYYIQTKLTYTGQGEIVIRVNALITEHLKSQPYSIIKKLNSDLRRDYTNKRLPIPQSWVDIFNEISSNKNQPILAKVTSLFKRKEK